MSRNVSIRLKQIFVAIEDSVHEFANAFFGLSFATPKVFVMWLKNTKPAAYFRAYLKRFVSTKSCQTQNAVRDVRDFDSRRRYVNMQRFVRFFAPSFFHPFNQGSLNLNLNLYYKYMQLPKRLVNAFNS